MLFLCVVAAQEKIDCKDDTNQLVTLGYLHLYMGQQTQIPIDPPYEISDAMMQCVQNALENRVVHSHHATMRFKFYKSLEKTGSPFILEKYFK